MVKPKRKGGAVLRSGKRTGSDVPNPNYITPVGTPAGSPVVPAQPQGHHHIQPFNPFPFGLFQPQELFPTFAPIPPNSEGETDNESEVSYGGRINPIPSVPFDGVETEVGQPRQLRNRPLDALPPFAVPTIVPTIVPDTALPDDRRRRVIIPFPDFDDIPDGGINMDNIEGGRRCPMEDHFFFPARDRDRRYDTVDYSRVVPHHRGFGMTNIF